MTITIKKLPSGFYSVWVNGCWVNAALSSLEEARRFAADTAERENRLQNERNSFENISIVEA